jgi:uncharacterized protein (TIGR03790 family)
MIEMNFRNESRVGRAGLPLLLAVACLLPAGRLAAGEGEQVVVAYNKRMSGSKDVAEYYAKARGVPKDQVIGLDLGTDENITREKFEDDLREPLAKQFVKRGFWKTGPLTIRDTNGTPVRTVTGVTESKVRYLVLCHGVPLRIYPSTNIVEAGSAEVRPELRRNEAAVDSELAMLPWARTDLTLNGPAVNYTFGSTNHALFHPTNAILMVARLDGATPQIARGLVDKALMAETNGLWGRAYFDLRGITNGPYALGDRWIGTAAEVSIIAGFETVVDRQAGLFPVTMPMSHIALYAGWYSGSVEGPFALNGVEFMPGAIAYHLHSFSAPSVRMKTAGWVGPLIAKGATASMGSVWEPYLSGTPEIGIVFARLLMNGFTFGEAAYSGSMMLSWMTTVVGDPLYRPFGTDLRQQYERLRAQKSPDVAWALMRLVNLNLVRGVPVAECATVLENAPETKDSSVLLEKLGDLYSAQGKPASAVLMWKRALEPETSLQQNIRIMLKLAERLASLDRDRESLDVYAKFLKAYPDYQGRLQVLRHAEPLARELEPALALAYTNEISRLTPPPPPPKTNAPGGAASSGAAKPAAQRR